MKKAITAALAAILLLILAGCEQTEEMKREQKDLQSSVDGLNRVAEVYDASGNVIKTYKGKFDVEVNEYGNKVKFDVDGHRVLIYNATVVIEETGGE
ncbi:protein of unknown function [Paenibacillus sophorae]|uniref:DUF5052 family protein n=1 Tax=Paenibacillus sophorae TaxID=1333845 RepID=A0A1H8VUA2_9BACL|nr:DUF5052 family protein [Paenibacillus sophorae]QWU15692.1 DUF5052 family protein [Paenibacillus sophorae]SEP18508.1 protein of unknown function [Paenibacillus sophorae]